MKDMSITGVERMFDEDNISREVKIVSDRLSGQSKAEVKELLSKMNIFMEELRKIT